MIKTTVSIKDETNIFQKVFNDIKSLDNAFVKVGFIDGLQVGNPTQVGSGKKPVTQMSEMVEIAVTNEFGNPKKRIPSRPFFRNAVDTNKRKIKTIAEKIYNRVLLGNMTPSQGLETLGVFMVSKIKRSITLLKTPPNAPMTIQRKKSSNPLIDTGQMRNSVNFIKILQKMAYKKFNQVDKVL